MKNNADGQLRSSALQFAGPGNRIKNIYVAYSIIPLIPYPEFHRFQKRVHLR